MRALAEAFGSAPRRRGTSGKQHLPLITQRGDGCRLRLTVGILNVPPFRIVEEIPDILLREGTNVGRDGDAIEGDNH